MSFSKSFILQNPQTISNKNLLLFLLLTSCTIFFILFPETCFAGTGGEAELKGIYDKLEGFASGYGGKIVAITSGIIAIWRAVKGDLLGFGPAALVTIIAGVGPGIFSSGVTALI